MLSRRSFFAAGAAALAAATFELDPERALRVRGAKTISVPAPAARPTSITFLIDDPISPTGSRLLRWIEMYGGEELDGVIRTIELPRGSLARLGLRNESVLAFA